MGISVILGFAVWKSIFLANPLRINDELNKRIIIKKNRKLLYRIFNISPLSSLRYSKEVCLVKLGRSAQSKFMDKSTGEGAQVE